jgi:Flp pilus assembly protein TadG
MMPSPVAPMNRAKGVFRRFGRNRLGSAAVEFALVAPLFFALLFAIIETALMFFATQVLETVTQQTARQVLTGQAQNANYSSLTQFINGAVCPQIPAIFVCANIYADVQSYPAFSNVVVNPPINNGNFDSSKFGYNPGGPGSTVVVRLFYQWPMFVTGLGYNIANLNGNMRLLQSTAAFQNEP